MSGVVDGAPVVPRLDVGQTARTALSLMGRNPGVVVPLGILLGAVPALLPSLLPFWPDAMQVIGSIFTETGRVIRVIDVLVGAASQALLIACLTHVALTDADGRRAGLGGSLDAGFRRILPLLGLSLASNLGIGVSLLLIVPGIILFVKWFCAVPVRVAEGPGIQRALNRSAGLVEGNRWRCFALILLFLVIPAIAMTGALYVVELFGYPDSSMPGAILGALVVGVYSTIYGVLPGVLYVQLRRLKDGEGPQQTATIFG